MSNEDRRQARLGRLKERTRRVIFAVAPRTIARERKPVARGREV